MTDFSQDVTTDFLGSFFASLLDCRDGADSEEKETKEDERELCANGHTYISKDCTELSNGGDLDL